MTFYLIHPHQWRATRPYEDYQIAQVDDQYRAMYMGKVIGGGTDFDTAYEAARVHCLALLNYFNS